MKKPEKYLRGLRELFIGLILCSGLGYIYPHNGFFGGLVTAAEAAGKDDHPQIDATPGLLWNRSGLPAIFPLQVKTSAGNTYFLTLIDAETGKETLAALIIGGDFFKVLVPPGTFVVRFATGKVWQGEARLFGPGAKTTLLELEQPLTFRVMGSSRKVGHLVDLSGNAPGQFVRAEVKGQSICQVMETDLAPLRENWYFLRENWHFRDFRQYRWAGYRYRTPKSVHILNRNHYSFAKSVRRHMFYRKYTVRSRFCE